MKNYKKIMALGLATAMTLSMAACGDNAADTNVENSANSGTEESSDPTENLIKDSETGARVINVGAHWIQYYDSASTSVEDDPAYLTSVDAEGDDEATLASKAFNRNVHQLKFDNVARIESKYNVEYYWNNLTWDGVRESINVSILAGAPDCEIYLADIGWAIAAQANGLALDLKTVLPEDDDLFTTQSNITYLDLGDGKACILKRVDAADQVGGTYPLAFNKQMLEDNNLEDPRELWERGEWTWDVFVQYCQTLTQDTDGDGQIDQYGFCGFSQEFVQELLMSNGTTIASGTTENLTSPEVGEVLQFISDMYNTYNICYPYDFESGETVDNMRYQYQQGNIGFWPMAAWMAGNDADYDVDGAKGVTLPFDTVYCRWPVGPSGDAETNAGKNVTGGEYYIIPAGIEDPATVYGVLYDFWNWYDGDISLRDNRDTLNWWYEITAKDPVIQEENFAVMQDCGLHAAFDLWNSLGFYYDWDSLIRGDVTPAQFQETYKQQVQDGLDAYFGN